MMSPEPQMMYRTAYCTRTNKSGFDGLDLAAMMLLRIRYETSYSREGSRQRSRCVVLYS